MEQPHANPDRCGRGCGDRRCDGPRPRGRGAGGPRRTDGRAVRGGEGARWQFSFARCVRDSLPRQPRSAAAGADRGGEGALSRHARRGVRGVSHLRGGKDDHLRAARDDGAAGEVRRGGGAAHDFPRLPAGAGRAQRSVVGRRDLRAKCERRNPAVHGAHVFRCQRRRRPDGAGGRGVSRGPRGTGRVWRTECGAGVHALADRNVSTRRDGRPAQSRHRRRHDVAAVARQLGRGRRQRAVLQLSARASPTIRRIVGCLRHHRMDTSATTSRRCSSRRRKRRSGGCRFIIVF